MVSRQQPDPLKPGRTRSLARARLSMLARLNEVRTKVKRVRGTIMSRVRGATTFLIRGIAHVYNRDVARAAAGGAGSAGLVHQKQKRRAVSGDRVA